MSLLIFQARLRFFHDGWMPIQTQWAIILAQNFHQNDVTYNHWYPYIYASLSNVILRLICLKIVNLSFSTHKPKMLVSRKISGCSTAIVCWSVVTLKGLNFQAEKSKNLKLFSPPTWLSPWSYPLSIIIHKRHNFDLFIIFHSKTSKNQKHRLFSEFPKVCTAFIIM